LLWNLINQGWTKCVKTKISQRYDISKNIFDNDKCDFNYINSKTKIIYLREQKGNFKENFQEY
jgi:hypothetical protein